MLRDACYILDLEKVPPMYVNQDPQPNAMCIGLDAPIIVVTTGLVELLDEEEMRAVVGHEVGHALSGHAVYRTILLFLTNLALKVAWIPLGNVAIMAIVTALREWFRKSELSADRAGLLVGQDLQASMRGLMKLAGGNHLHEMNVDSFLAQAEEYESGGDLRDSVLKIMNVLPRSHPFTTVRAAELKKWAASRDYQRIMDGHYDRARGRQGHLGRRLVPAVGQPLLRVGEEQQGPADGSGAGHRRRRGRPRAASCATPSPAGGRARASDRRQGGTGGRRRPRANGSGGDGGGLRPGHGGSPGSAERWSPAARTSRRSTGPGEGVGPRQPRVLGPLAGQQRRQCVRGVVRAGQGARPASNLAHAQLVVAQVVGVEVEAHLAAYGEEGRLAFGVLALARVGGAYRVDEHVVGDDLQRVGDPPRGRRGCR